VANEAVFEYSAKTDSKYRIAIQIYSILHVNFLLFYCLLSLTDGGGGRRERGRVQGVYN
jgi:hypothetical protein